MKIKYKKMHPNAVAPAYANDFAAGLDLSTSVAVTVKPLEPVLLPTGIAVEIPEGCVGLLALRSSTPKKKGLFIPNGVGIIDCDYRGELFVMVAALKDEVVIEAGNRVAQLVIVPARQLAGVHITSVEEVQSLTVTDRGHGGFGSTG